MWRLESLSSKTPDPGRAVPLPTGGSEDHCPQAAMGGQERHLRGHSGPAVAVRGLGRILFVALVYPVLLEALDAWES